jgi:hypothetical protein
LIRNRKDFQSPIDRHGSQEPSAGVIPFLSAVMKRIVKNGAEAQNRTADTRLFRPLLYQLSYLGIVGASSSRTIK